jgi:hypothetical protein
MTSYTSKISALVILLFLFPYFLSAQEGDIFGIERKISGRKSESDMGNIFRNAISKFSLEISSGAGYHQNHLNFLSVDSEAYPISNLFDAQLPVDMGAENITFVAEEYAVPIHVGVRVDMFGLFTIGGGYGKEFGKMSPFQTTDYALSLEGSSYTFDRFYGTFGLVLYNARRRAALLNWRYRKYSGNNIYMQRELSQRVRDNFPWVFVLEGEYGSVKISKTYDSHLNVTEPFYSLGLRIEREFSEYAKLFVKPGVSFSKFSYNRSVVQNNVDVMEIQSIDQKMYAIQLGLSISIPGTKRCKVGGCGVVMKHLHNGVEYRGSSIWKMQNRKVGQW